MVLSVCYVLSRLSTFSTYFRSTNCFIILGRLIYQPECYILPAIYLIFDSFLVLYPIIMNRNSKPEPKIDSLILEFPESLHFWSPNFYFGRFLRRLYPQHVRYRPFMADILRFDYKITEPDFNLETTRSTHFQLLEQ